MNKPEISRCKKAMELSDTDFKQIIGVTKKTFDAMAEILREAYAAKHTRRGRHAKLSIEEQLFLSRFKYLRQYVTQKELACRYLMSLKQQLTL